VCGRAGGGGGGNTPDSRLYREAPPKRGTFSTLAVSRRVRKFAPLIC